MNEWKRRSRSWTLGVLFQISFAFPSLWFLLIIVVLLSPTRPFWRNDDDLTHFFSKKVLAASNSCILSFSLAPISGVQLLKRAKKSWWGGRNEMKWWDFNETTRGNQQIAQVRRDDLLVCSILFTITPPLRSSWGGGLMVEWIHGWDSCVCTVPIQQSRESSSREQFSAGALGRNVFLYIRNRFD